MFVLFALDLALKLGITCVHGALISYCTWSKTLLNAEYILVFKDGLREGEECIEQLQFCLNHLKTQPNCFYSVINQGD